jgi:transposase-like protein
MHGSEEAVGAAMRPPLSDDHGQLKRRLRPMRSLKTDQSDKIIIAGHAFIQNIRRGHYELGVDEPMTLRVVAAFDELVLAI